MNICGIDEAGRGTLAGSMFVAGVVLHSTIKGLMDSKKLTPKKRELLYTQIIQNSDYLILSYCNETIDKNGLSWCIKDALIQIKSKFKKQQIIFDGNSSFGVEGIETLVKADTKITQVSAASILAKVSKDREMIQEDSIYPTYGFAKHKGYGTKHHLEMLLKHSYCKIHRKSFKGVIL